MLSELIERQKLFLVEFEALGMNGLRHHLSLTQNGLKRELFGKIIPREEKR